MAADQPDAALIAAALSPERLAPYLRATGGDLTAALRLYEWNLAVSGALYELHTVRNRIAHHEPIHSRTLTADTLTIYRLLDWIDADIRAWAVSLSRLQPIIAARPN